VKLILDTSPWVALHCRDERHHEWAKAQFAQTAEPLLTCEAVVAETCFLLARAGFDPAKALALIERGVVQIALSLCDEAAAVRALFQRYDNVPASLADACLIRARTLPGRHARQRLPRLSTPRQKSDSALDAMNLLPA
jgi:uncharacterized protein